MSKTTAYCTADGGINFCPAARGALPSGALPIITGPERKVRYIIEVTARHAYDNKTFLVPGVPEAPDQQAGLTALQKYIAWISPRLAEPMAFDAEGNRIEAGDTVICDHADAYGPLADLEAEVTYLCKNGKVKLRAEGRMKPLVFFKPPEQTHLHQRGLS